MAILSNQSELEKAIEEDLAIERETFISTTINQSKFKVDNLGVVWRLEDGDGQCPECSAIVEAGEPACLCVLSKCIDEDGNVNLDLIPF